MAKPIEKEDLKPMMMIKIVIGKKKDKMHEKMEKAIDKAYKKK